MEKWTKRLKFVGTFTALAMSVGKIVADLRLHGKHDGHGQQCKCLPNCTHCVAAAAAGKLG